MKSSNVKYFVMIYKHLTKMTKMSTIYFPNSNN